MCAILASGLALSSLAPAPTVGAQQRFQTLGPNDCINCHDHQTDREWWEKKESPEVRRLFPAKGANAGHINSMKQLEEKKGDAWAAAIGLKDKYDPRGACVRCHATVFKGDANAGVSCESCHGPGSEYLKPHQTKGTYDQATKLGMTPLVGNIQAWVQQCTTCHVMDDARLVQAGHPSGDDFNLGMRFQPVSIHFKKKYDANQVAQVGAQFMQAQQRKRGGPVQTTPAPPPPPTPPPVQPPVTTPPQQQQQQQQQTPPPVQQTPPPVVPQQQQPPPVPPQQTQTQPPPQQSAQNTAPPPDVSTPVVPHDPDPLAALTPASPSASAPAVEMPASTSPSSLLAMLQGKLIVALADILGKGAAAPIPIKTRTALAGKYSGPDAALLQLQADAIALALEALGTAPAKK